MRREERVTVQSVKKQQPHGMSHRGSQGGLGTTCLCNFPASAPQKWKFPKLFFFNILTIHNDQISYAKHVLDPIHLLFTLFGCLDGGKGLGHNLLMQFSTRGGSTMEIFRTKFFSCFGHSWLGRA